MKLRILFEALVAKQKTRLPLRLHYLETVRENQRSQIKALPAHLLVLFITHRDKASNTLRVVKKKLKMMMKVEAPGQKLNMLTSAETQTSDRQKTFQWVSFLLNFSYFLIAINFG